MVDAHETLRTQCFREQMASPEAPWESRIEPKPLFLKRLSAVSKIGFECDLEAPESVRCLGIRIFNFALFYCVCLIMLVCWRVKTISFIDFRLRTKAFSES